MTCTSRRLPQEEPNPRSVTTFLGITARAAAPHPRSHPPLPYLALLSCVVTSAEVPGWVTQGFISLPCYSNRLVRHLTFTPAGALPEHRAGEATQPVSPSSPPPWGRRWTALLEMLLCKKSFLKGRKRRGKWLKIRGNGENDAASLSDTRGSARLCLELPCQRFPDHTY